MCVRAFVCVCVCVCVCVYLEAEVAREAQDLARGLERVGALLPQEPCERERERVGECVCVSE